METGDLIPAHVAIGADYGNAIALRMALKQSIAEGSPRFTLKPKPHPLAPWARVNQSQRQERKMITPDSLCRRVFLWPVGHETAPVHGFKLMPISIWLDLRYLPYLRFSMRFLMPTFARR